MLGEGGNLESAQRWSSERVVSSPSKPQARVRSPAYQRPRCTLDGVVVLHREHPALRHGEIDGAELRGRLGDPVAVPIHVGVERLDGRNASLGSLIQGALGEPGHHPTPF